MAYQDIAENLDIIIPAYNAVDKIRRTLMTFEGEYPFNFTIVLDGEPVDEYLNMLQIFNGIYNINFIPLNENQGPGIARNIGLTHTNKEYVLFFDAGDTLMGMPIFQSLLNDISQHPEFYLTSAAHYEEQIGALTIVGAAHNRMHGKFFKRDFLQKYDIKFLEKCSRLNEDIGFNMSARMLARNESLQDNINHIYHYETPIICWRNDENSITRQNNCAFYYQKNNLGLSLNATYAIEKARSFNVRKELVNEIIYSVMSSLYIFYYSTVNQRPEFTQEQLEGTFPFYNNILKEFFKTDFNEHDFVIQHNNQIKELSTDSWHPYFLCFPDKNVMQWFDFIAEEAEKFKDNIDK